MVNRKSKEIRQRKICLKKRVYKTFNEVSFLSSIKDAKEAGLFAKVTDATDINEAVKHFNEAFTSVLDNHAPIKVIQHHKNYAPYLSSSLKERMKYRDSLKKAWITSGNEDIHTDYKSLRNKVCKEIKEAKTKYYETRLNSNNSKNAWSTTNQMIGHTVNDFPQQMIIDNKLETNPANLADEMNSFFVKKVTDLKKDFASDDKEDEEALVFLKKHLQNNNKENLNFDLLEIDDDGFEKRVK